MEDRQPIPLCTLSRDWRTVSHEERTALFATVFTPWTSTPPNEDIAAAIDAYADLRPIPIGVCLVATNHRWSVYMVDYDIFGAYWVAVRQGLGTTLELASLSRAQAEELEIPAIARICRFPCPPPTWQG